MRRRMLLAACSGILLLGVAAAAHPIAKDFPSERPARGLDDAGLDEVEGFLGSNAPAGRSDRRARNISLVGAYRAADGGAVGGTAGYKKLAFLGKWGRPCPASGVEIIDISRPSAPVKLAETAEHPNTSKGRDGGDGDRHPRCPRDRPPEVRAPREDRGGRQCACR